MGEVLLLVIVMSRELKVICQRVQVLIFHPITFTFGSAAPVGRLQRSWVMRCAAAAAAADISLIVLVGI
jgi:hypothetical protein